MVEFIAQNLFEDRLKIRLVNVRLSQRTKSLANRDHLVANLGFNCYLSSHMIGFVVCEYEGCYHLIPFANVLSLTVDPRDIPEHQPLGTPLTHDTPSGQRKRYQKKSKGQHDFPKSEPLVCTGTLEPVDEDQASNDRSSDT